MPIDLYNVQTRKREDLKEGDQAAAILAGTHSVPAAATVDVVSPEGKGFTVSGKDLPTVLQAGYSLQTTQQKAVEDYVRDNQGIKGDLKVGLGQFADELLSGVPELIYDKTADPLDVAKKEALKQEHATANVLAGIGGFGASMFAPGVNLLFKGASKAGATAGEIVARNLATRLETAAGEQLGARTAMTAAKALAPKLAGSMAQMGTEGAVLSAPRAITEAALGDPAAAAETVLAGVGVGALFGAGGTMAKEFVNLSKDAAKWGAKTLGVGEVDLPTISKKIAKVFTGVPEDAIGEYVANPEMINAAPERTSIKDGLDALFATRKQAVTTARGELKAARAERDAAYQGARFDLSRTRPPESLADDLVGALEQEKSVLGQLSEQADDVLEQSGLTFKKKDLLSFLDDVGGSIGVGEKGALVSDEAVSAAGKLKAQRDRIAEGFDKDISAADLRGILRDVRRDINYNQLAGEFNDTLNRTRKTFTQRISSVLKEQVPEYASLMEEMGSRSDALERMSQAFGSKERAIGSLNSILTPKGKIKDDLLHEFGELTGRDYVGQLDQYKLANSMLEASRREDIKHVLVPELHAKMQELEQRLASAEARFEPIRRLTPQRTQAIIRNQGFKHASIEDARALVAAADMAGTDFSQQIRHRNILDAFSKESTNGSRKTLLGALIGGVAGGPVASATMGGLGAIADIYGGVMLKRLIDKTPQVSGILFAERAMKNTATALDDVPKMLMRMSERAPVAARTAALGAALRLVGEKPTPGAPPADQVEKFNEKAGEWVSNPARASAAIAALTGPLSHGGAPGIGGAFNAKLLQSFQYLYKQSPKPPAPKSPFSPQHKWKPSHSQVLAFEEKAAVVENPFVVFNELEHGTLTRNHMDALKAVYPAIYGMMQKKIAHAATSGATPMTYQARLKLSMLMGAPLDESLSPARVSSLQQTFAQPQAAPAQQGGGGGGSPHVSTPKTVGAGSMSDATRLLTKKG